METEKEVLEGGKLVYVPKQYFARHRSTRKKNKWVRMWFYKDRRKQQVYPFQVRHDYDITSKLEYCQGTFYKLSQLSAEDDTFDFYYKLKSGLPKDIFKRNNRYKTPLVRKTRRNSWKNNPVPRTYEANKEGKFVVSFESHL